MTLRYELRFIIIIITIINIIIFGRDWLKGNIQTIGPTQSPLGHPPSCRQLSPSLLRSQHQQSLSIIKERRRQINSQLTKASRYTAAWGGTNPQVIKPWIQAKIWKANKRLKPNLSFLGFINSQHVIHVIDMVKERQWSMLSVKPVRITMLKQFHQKSPCMFGVMMGVFELSGEIRIQYYLLYSWNTWNILASLGISWNI